MQSHTRLDFHVLCRLLHPAIMSLRPKSPATDEPDYYDIAQQSYQMTRAVIKRVPPITPADLSVDRQRRFVSLETYVRLSTNRLQLLMKAEYRIWACRLQDISRKALHIEHSTLVEGVREEMVFFLPPQKKARSR